MAQLFRWRAGTIGLAVAALAMLLGTAVLATPASAAAFASVQVTAAAADPDAGLWVRTWASGPSAQQQVTVSRDPAFTGRRPAVFFIHGGGWAIGSQAAFATEARVWARNGWVAVNLDYRLKVKGTLMHADVTRTVAHFRTASYVDKTRMILYGSSAGGHLATWVGTQMGAPAIAGVVAWSPVVSPYHAYLDGIAAGHTAVEAGLGAKALKYFGYDWAGTSALTEARDANAPPMWLAGSKNEQVRWSTQGGALCRALGPKKCTSHVVPGTTHAWGIAVEHQDLLQAARDWADELVAR
jgi:acetyl esterase/lipase